MTIYRRSMRLMVDMPVCLLGTYLYTDSIGSTATVALPHSLHWCNGADERVFTGGGRAAQGDRQEGAQRNETRHEAQHSTAQAQTQGQHGHEWSPRQHRQGRACTIDGRGKASRIHPLHPSHTPSGPSQPRSTSASQANATPAGTRSLAASNAI
jgi:hypothetical protein